MPEKYKIQLPLETNAPIPMALVYNRDRNRMGEIPITKEIRDLFPPGVVKIFIEGSFNPKDGTLDVKVIHPDPNAFDW
ncbi:hypothetical protein LCGC14_0481620 [marine sediment metagenome]|uniref:Uncharacterized protein n=1 Tax=marine sediment metagenome TaxID=412755 RepID=A0A0F9SSE3_9ZZZZ